LQVPHHGSKTSAVEFLSAVEAEVAVISVGEGNRYGHPAPEILDALGDTVTLRTGLDGLVSITSDGTRVGIRARRRRGLVPPGCGIPAAAVPSQHPKRLGDGRVFDASPGDSHKEPARSGTRPARGTHAGNPAADRPGVARRRKPGTARAEDEHGRLG